MGWEKILKLVLEQSPGIVIGLLLAFLAVHLIEPNTSEGAILLMVIVMAVFVMAWQGIGWAVRRLRKPQPGRRDRDVANSGEAKKKPTRAA